MDFDVRQMFERHWEGLAVEGVTRAPDHAGSPAWSAYERWVKRNPGLAQLISFGISTLIALAALGVALTKSATARP